MTTTTTQYRAYDTTTEWRGPSRSTVDAAQADADRHNGGCIDQGGYGRAVVVVRARARRLLEVVS